MEREGKGEGEREGRREGEREMRKGRRGIIAGGIILGLLFGCNNGIAELEKKNSFYESVVKIGQGFQEIFGIFGNAMGDALGFSAVKSDDTRDKVGAHFDKVKKGLEGTNGKLKELSGKMSEARNADTKGVDVVIKGASEVLTKLIDSVTKLAGVTNATTKIGESAEAGSALAANKASVDTIIAGVKEIIELAEKSGVKIDKGNYGNPVTASDQTSASAALAANNNATAKSGPLLADEVAKADPWAMIDKIKSAKTGAALSGANNEAGALATAIAAANNTGAATNADLVAAVALKAMTKDGKFSNAANEAGAIKAAAASAVNKVLGVLDVIIMKTVNQELSKIKDAVKEIKYFENTGTNATEASTSNK